MIGLEIARRLDRPALVLAPTATIAAQWADKLSLFTDQATAFLAPGGPLHVLTYQSICQTTDPGGALRAAAEERLIAERAVATGATPDTVRAEVEAFSGAARERFERDLAVEIARLKRASVSGDSPALTAGVLLSAPARRRLDELVAADLGTVVLDECHHLASLWGYLVRAAMAELADLHVVGLTATSPSELSGEDAALYASILGPVDFQIPTPAACGTATSRPTRNSRTSRLRWRASARGLTNGTSGYVVSRPAWPEGRRAGAVFWRALTFRDALGVSWHPVPSDLGSHKERATTYHVAWQLHVGPGELLFAGRQSAAGREESAASATAAYVTSRRTLWH